MSPHDYQYTGEDDADHKFACSQCGAEVWFNKPGVGAPNAVEGDEGLLPAPEYQPGGSCNPEGSCGV